MYPKRIKKYQTPSGPIGTDTKQFSPSAVGIMGTATNAGTLGFQAYKTMKPDTQDDLGLTNVNTTERGIQGGLKGAQMGLAAAPFLGPAAPFVVAGAAVGGYAHGMITAGKEIKENAKKTREIRLNMRKPLDTTYTQNTKMMFEDTKRQRALIPSNYKMYSAKHGGIFPKLQQGGVTPHAVIPSGPLHSEKNNLGTKGLPVVHSETNEKKAEVEREEIIFTKPQSEVLEKFHKELTANPTDEGYIKFGEIVGKFINGAKDMNDE